MSKGRLEAFSDGVLAIIITIMVLELRPPHTDTIESLKPLWPVFLSYILSFVTVGIYWNNHHHMFQATQKVNGRVLWSNTHLLFWLSLLPFATAWMGENHFTTIPIALYGGVLWMCGFAYYILAHSLQQLHGKDAAFSKALGNDQKGKLSLVLYTLGIGVSFIHPLLGFSSYVLVTLMWFVPDRRFENQRESS